MNLDASRKKQGVMTMPLRILSALISLLAILLPQAVRADDVDPDQLARARKYLEITHSQDLASQEFDLMLANLEKSMEEANPGKTEIVKNLMREVVTAATRDQVQVLVDEFARTYARHFSKEELDQLIAFYETPVGRKEISEAPVMLSEVMQTTMPFMRTRVAKARAILREKAPALGLDLPGGM